MKYYCENPDGTVEEVPEKAVKELIEQGLAVLNDHNELILPEKHWHHCPKCRARYKCLKEFFEEKNCAYSKFVLCPKCKKTTLQ